MVKMFSNYQISIISNVKISYFYVCSNTTFLGDRNPCKTLQFIQQILIYVSFVRTKDYIYCTCTSLLAYISKDLFEYIYLHPSASLTYAFHILIRLKNELVHYPFLWQRTPRATSCTRKGGKEGWLWVTERFPLTLFSCKLTPMQILFRFT